MYGEREPYPVIFIHQRTITMNQRVLLTARGAQNLQDELRRLKSKDRPQVIAAIAEARAHGDLSENAEYDAAKEQQGFIEGRIAELQASLAIAEVIAPAKTAPEKIIFGTYVALYDTDADETRHYQLVGGLEADIQQRTLSIDSPIGKAMLGKQSGDEFHVVAPGGTRIYEIIAIDHQPHVDDDAK